MASFADKDYATTDGLTEAVTYLLPALEKFTRFDEPEQTGRQKAIWSAQLDETLPGKGVGAEEVLKQLRDVVIPHGLRAGAPGFSGWVATMPTTLPAAAHLTSAIAGPLCVAVQSYNLLEALAMRWLREMLNLPEVYQGIFTSGGSVANLIGIGAARQYAFERLGIDPAHDGVSALPKPRIYASEQVHHVIYRAAAVLGLGRRAVVTIPTDETFRIDLEQLKQRVLQDQADGYTPIAIVANAGTINTGAVDPLPAIADFCLEQKIWLHVDGAYGLLGVLDPEVSALYGNLAGADSLVVDPHKWLATSMGCGAILVRNSALLGRAFTLMPAVYIEGSQPTYDSNEPLTSQFDDFGYMFHEFGVEHSLPSRGVEVWAVLKEIGVEGVRERIRRHNSYARRLATLINASRHLELAAPVTLSTCCFRYIPESLRGRNDAESLATINQLNRTLLARMRARGRCMPSATNLHDAFVIRTCFINPRTTLADIDALIQEAELCGKELTASASAAL